MRATVLSPSFLPLQDFAWVRLALMATFPSGENRMVDLRRRLGKEMLGLPMTVPSCTPPRVLHASFAAATLSPDSVFVGHPKSEQQTTPYTCPFVCESYSRAAAQEYVEARADAAFLANLGGRTIVCDCSRPVSECWAYLLHNAACDALAADISCDSDGSGVSVRGFSHRPVKTGRSPGESPSDRSDDSEASCDDVSLVSPCRPVRTGRSPGESPSVRSDNAEALGDDDASVSREL